MANIFSKSATSGVKSLTKDMGALKEGAFVAVLALATGANKAKAAWEGFAWAFTTRVLGPVGQFTAIAAGAMSALTQLGKAFASMGMEASKSMEKLTTQFKPLLQGINTAKQRMAELAKFAASTPFQLAGVVESNKTLQSLTKGALATKEGMKLVGDAAAVAGVPMEEMATTIGRLYDGLQSGRPVGQVAERLQELGVISGGTRNQLESMQEAGRAGSEVWKVAATDIGKANGAMQDMMQTLQGLQSNLDDNKDAFQRAFADNYLEGEKIAVKAASDAYEKMAPIIGEVGKQMAVTSNYWEKFKAYVLELVTSIPGLGKVLVFLTGALQALLTAILALSAAMAGKFAISILRTTAASASAAQGFVLLATSAKLAAAATKDLAGASTLAEATLAKEALTSAKASAISGAAMVRAGGIAGVMKAALLGLGAGLKVVGGLIKGLAKDLIGALATPLGFTIALLISAAMVYKHFADKTRDAKLEIISLNAAIKEQNSLLDKQRNNIRTIADLNAQYAAELTAVTQAQERLSDAELEAIRHPTDEQAQKRLESAQKGVKDRQKGLTATQKIKTSMLESGPNLMSEEERLRQQKALADAHYEFGLSQAAPDQRIKMMQARKQQINDRNDVFQNSRFNTETSQDTQRTLGFGKAALTAGIKNKEKKIEDARGSLQAESSKEDMDVNKVNALMKYMEDAGKEVTKLKAALASMPDSAKELDKVFASKNPIDIMQAKIAAIDELKAANDALLSSTQKLNEAEVDHDKNSKGKGGNKQAKEEAIQREKDAKAAINLDKARIKEAEKIAKRLGIDPSKSARTKEDLQGRINFEREQQQRSPNDKQAIEDQEAITKKEVRLKAQEGELSKRQKDAEVENLSPLKAAYELKVKMIAIERDRLTNLREAGHLTEDEVKAANKNLDAEEKILDIETQRAAMKAKLAQTSEGLAQDAEIAEKHGRTTTARHLRERQRNGDRERRKQELIDEGKATFQDTDSIKKHVREGLNQFDKATKQSRSEERLAKAADSINNIANAWMNMLSAFKALMDKVREYKWNLKVKELRATGNDMDAEQANRMEQQKEFDQRVKAVMDDTGTNRKDAEQYVNREMKAAHDEPINKTLKELNTNLDDAKKQQQYDMTHPEVSFHKAQTVASSMSKIGGATAFMGSDFFKTDGQKAHEDSVKIQNILKQIANAASDQYTVHSMSPPVKDYLTVYLANGGRTNITV